MRRRIKNILIAAAPALALAGIIVVSAGQNPPNVDLDCVFDNGSGYCNAILEPPRAQCAALFARPDDTSGVSRRVYRALRELEEVRIINGVPSRAIESWVVLPRDDSPLDCYVEVRLTVFRRTLPDGRRVLDGQAPAWRDTVNAADLASIVKAGHVSRRPSYALRGGCRSHVYFGEDPCAGAEEIADAGYIDDPDGGP